jgi:hypothetical protein
MARLLTGPSEAAEPVQNASLPLSVKPLTGSFPGKDPAPVGRTGEISPNTGHTRPTSVGSERLCTLLDQPGFVDSP